MATKLTTKQMSAANVGYDVARNDQNAAERLLKLGSGDQIRDAYKAGYVAFKMHPNANALSEQMVQDGMILLAKAAKQRTTEQNKWETACRASWSRFAKKHSVKTTEKRGGAAGAKAANATKAQKKAAGGTSKPQQKAPAIVTPRDTANYVMDTASTMLAYCNKNAKKVPAPFMNLVTEFKAKVMHEFANYLEETKGK